MATARRRTTLISGFLVALLAGCGSASSPSVSAGASAPRPIIGDGVLRPGERPAGHRRSRQAGDRDPDPAIRSAPISTPTGDRSLGPPPSPAGPQPRARTGGRRRDAGRRPRRAERGCRRWPGQHPRCRLAGIRPDARRHVGCLAPPGGAGRSEGDTSSRRSPWWRSSPMPAATARPPAHPRKPSA